MVLLSTSTAHHTQYSHAKSHCSMPELFIEKLSARVSCFHRWVLLQTGTLYPLRGNLFFPAYLVACFSKARPPFRLTIVLSKNLFAFPEVLHQLQLLPELNYTHGEPALRPSVMISSFSVLLQVQAHLRINTIPCCLSSAFIHRHAYYASVQTWAINIC